jgi:hypothetical protein
MKKIVNKVVESLRSIFDILVTKVTTKKSFNTGLKKAFRVSFVLVFSALLLLQSFQYVGAIVRS